MDDALKELMGVSLYHAPRDTVITSVRVAPETEYLELLTAGHTFFEGPDGHGREYGRGTLFWHMPAERTICRYRGDDPYSCYVFRFRVVGGGRPCPRITIPFHTERLIGFAEDAFRQYHSGEQGNAAFCAMVYATLLWYAQGSQREPDEPYPDSLKAALAFMESRVADKLSVAGIAAAAGISPSHLFPVFRRWLKRSPYQVLLEMRISRAKQLLAGGEMPIKEIAAECGFDSLEVFYHRFVGSEGTAPGAYRRRFAPRNLSRF